MVPFTSLPDSTVSKPPLKAENWAVQPFRLGVGAPKVDGHQIGSPLLSRSCACWLPSASLSPDESTITTFVPLGTPDKLLDEGAVRVAVHRLRHRYRELLREEIGGTLSNPAQVQEELRALQAALSNAE